MMTGFTRKFILRSVDLELPEGMKRETQYNSVDDLVPLIRKMTDGEVQEVAVAIFLSPVRELIGCMEVARGGMESVNVDMRLVFTAALLCGARTIVLAHNHPNSTQAKASRQDVAAMKKNVVAAARLNLFLMDHIVVAPTTHVSMAEYGLLPPLRELVEDAEKEMEKAMDLEALKLK